MFWGLGTVLVFGPEHYLDCVLDLKLLEGWALREPPSWTAPSPWSFPRIPGLGKPEKLPGLAGVALGTRKGQAVGRQMGPGRGKRAWG